MAIEIGKQARMGEWENYIVDEETIAAHLGSDTLDEDSNLDNSLDREENILIYTTIN